MQFRTPILTAAISVAAGLLLVLAGWGIVRAVAGTPSRLALRLILDGIIPFAAFDFVCTLTARPIFAGAAVFAVLCSLAAADRSKRNVLSEPIVFFDVYQTVDVVIRHPQVNLLFGGGWKLPLSLMAFVAAFAAMFLVEPAVAPLSPVWPVALVAGAVLAVWAVGWPLLGPSGRLLRALGPSGDPGVDAASLGPFAMHFAHVVIARAERPARRSQANARYAVIPKCARVSGPSPVIVVQSESFFDPRRLHAGVQGDLLPEYDACAGVAHQWGRLAVPGVGANTMRTEFAVLTGLSEDAIGFDRFNPYHAFARLPVATLASRLKASGYRTICIHPYDRKFYRRDLVMPNLGFDAFLGEEAFAGADRSGLYVSDAAVARLALDLVAKEGPRVFVFAITMENHGPWLIDRDAYSYGLTEEFPPIAEQAALSRFVQGVRRADAMIGTLKAALGDRDDGGVLAFYGDHLPSFPRAFSRLGFNERHSDYLVWRAGGGLGTRRDISAHDLGSVILEALDSEIALSSPYRQRLPPGRAAATVSGLSFAAR